jgi:hypothetical protein
MRNLCSLLARPCKGARTAGGKVRTWTFWLLTIAIASRFYVFRELLAAFAFFGIGFAALAFVVLSLCLVQKGWELAAVRIFDSERGAIWLAAEDGARSKSAQQLKTKKRNSKDWRGKGSVNWADRENCAERIWGH